MLDCEDEAHAKARRREEIMNDECAAITLFRKSNKPVWIKLITRRREDAKR